MKINKEFVVFTGPMWSGKTTRLTAAVERHKIRKTNVICFKPKKDVRYSESNIVTHSGSKIEAINVTNGKDILDIVKRMNPEVVAVDEAFMIQGCSDALIEIFKSGISVYVSSLELSANLNAFSEIKNMLPYATRVEKCAAVCVKCGEDAALTHRHVESNEEISVGGEDSYEPLCWSCHPLTKYF